jgi:hypothetical protein
MTTKATTNQSATAHTQTSCLLSIVHFGSQADLASHLCSETGILAKALKFVLEKLGSCLSFHLIHIQPGIPFLPSPLMELKLTDIVSPQTVHEELQVIANPTVRARTRRIFLSAPPILSSMPSFLVQFCVRACLALFAETRHSGWAPRPDTVWPFCPSCRISARPMMAWLPCPVVGPIAVFLRISWILFLSGNLIISTRHVMTVTENPIQHDRAPGLLSADDSSCIFFFL